MEVRVHVLKSHGREIQDPLGVTDRLATTNNILYDNTKTCILYFIWQFRECCLSLKHSKNNLPSSSIPLGYFNSSADLRAFVHFLWCDSGSVKECWSQIVAVTPARNNKSAHRAGPCAPCFGGCHIPPILIYWKAHSMWASVGTLGLAPADGRVHQNSLNLCSCVRDDHSCQTSWPGEIVSSVEVHAELWKHHTQRLIATAYSCRYQYSLEAHRLLYRFNFF